MLAATPGAAAIDWASVRLTADMLASMRVEAHEVIRFVLMRGGVINDGSGEHTLGAERHATLVTGREVRRCTASFYGPLGLAGSPSFFIDGLTPDATPGDVILIGVVGGELIGVLVQDDHRGVPAHLAGVINDRAPEASAIESDIADLSRMLREVAELGWIPALGRGAPTVGETLEHALGMQRNSFRTPDFRGRIEIKSSRAGAAKLQTLFSQVPDWRAPVLGTGDLVRAYGRPSRKADRLDLYCSVTTTPNTLGWDLEPRVEDGLIVARNAGVPVLYFPIAKLERALLAKHGATVYVSAESRRVAGAEELRYTGASLRTGVRFANFLAELQAGMVGLDLVAHATATRARDHGYLWRIQRDRLPALYTLARVLL